MSCHLGELDFGKTLVHGVSADLENVLNTAGGYIKHKKDKVVNWSLKIGIQKIEVMSTVSFQPSSRQQVCALSKPPL